MPATSSRPSPTPRSRSCSAPGPRLCESLAATKFALDRATANSPADLEAAKKALWLDQQAQQQQEMPAARARLERLIETRATEKAKQLYEEQKRLDLAAVKAELEPDDD